LFRGIKQLAYMGDLGLAMVLELDMVYPVEYQQTGQHNGQI